MGISAKVLDSTPAPILVSVLALLSVQGNIGYRRFLPVRCNSFLASYRGLPTVRLSQMRSFRNGSSGFSFLGDWLAGRSGLLCRDSCCSVAWIRELCQARLEVPAAAAVGLSFCSTKQADRQMHRVREVGVGVVSSV